MSARLIRDGGRIVVSDKEYVIEEGEEKPINTRHDENGNLIIDIIKGSTLIEILDAGGINTYIFSEKTNSWRPM